MKDREKEYLVFHRESCNVDAQVSSFKMTGKSKADIRKKFNIINHVITDIKLIKAVDDNKEGAADSLIENEVIVEDFNPLGAKADIQVGMVELDNGLIISENKYKEYCKSLKKIKTCYREAGNLYLEIGCELYKVNYCGLYTVELADNIYEYAANNFGISRGTTNEYLNVVKNFCDYEAGGYSSKAHPIPVLKEKYKDYCVSQLIILMRVQSDELKKKLVPSLSTRKMKELIKKDQESKNEHSKNEHSKDEQSKDEQSKDEQSKDEQSKDEHSKDEQSKDEHSKDEQSKDEHSKDRQSLTDGRYIALVRMESSLSEELIDNNDKYEKVWNGFRFKVQNMIYSNGCWYDESLVEFKENIGDKVISWQVMPTVDEMLNKNKY